MSVYVCIVCMLIGMYLSMYACFYVNIIGVCIGF